jgi:hypothetical protein
VTASALAVVMLAAALSCARTERAPAQRTFETPEAAAQALIATVKAGNMPELLAIFGPDSQDLVSSSDPATGQRNREVFTIAAAEKWRLEDEGANAKTLVIGKEDWPFPIPLLRDTAGWRFDTASGKEEVLARRIGRNELAVIQICHAYVAAQRLYAQHPRDGKPTGLYAASFRSDPGRQNGLYWPTARGEKRSPLGDLVARAAEGGRRVDTGGEKPQAFRGYYFKILTSQGPSAAGGAKDYVVGGAMSGGFALVAWPAEYDVTGIMTFIVNQDGVVHEKDLGPETDKSARMISAYDPDSSWTAVR